MFNTWPPLFMLYTFRVTVYSATTSSPDMGYRQMVTRNTTDGLDLTIKLSGVGVSWLDWLLAVKWILIDPFFIPQISKGSPYLHAAPKKSVAIHIHDGNKPCLYCLQGHHN